MFVLGGERKRGRQALSPKVIVKRGLEGSGRTFQTRKKRAKTPKACVLGMFDKEQRTV